MNRPLCIALLALVAACGQATNASYRGEPLVSLHGQLTVPSGATVAETPVRLALAWYPALPSGDESDPRDPPRSIVTEDVPYQGTFPLSYGFSIYTLPPADALTEISGAWGTTRAGVGILIAYQDRNGNGALDTIAPGGGPVDVVLGSSLGKLSSGSPLQDVYSIVYIDGAAPPDSPAEIQQGFNLIRLPAGNVVPFSTLVPIELSAAAELNILVCEEAWRGADPDLNSCIPRAPEPPVVPALAVVGSMGIVSNASAINLKVTDGTNTLSTATMTVNGRSIPYQASSQQHVLFDSSNPFLLDGNTNEIRVQADGLSELVLRVPMPGKFQVTAPAFNASISSGSTVTVTWTASAGAKSYGVTIYDAGFSELFDGKTTAQTLTTPAITYTGSATLNVEAEVDSISTPEGSFVVPYVNTGEPLQFVP